MDHEVQKVQDCANNKMAMESSVPSQRTTLFIAHTIIDTACTCGGLLGAARVKAISAPRWQRNSLQTSEILQIWINWWPSSCQGATSNDG